jgi:signal transduction histidine kinase
MGDGVRMEQIMMNLLDNALRYTSEGKITVRMHATDAQVIIAVEDTGPGIPPEEQPYVCERFYRVEKSRSRELGGTGLGLSIVKRLVELQEGEIEVRTRPGQGTIFRVAFPIQEVE